MARLLCKCTYRGSVRYAGLAVLVALLLASCKKHENEGKPSGNGNTRQTTTSDPVLLHADSLFLYAKEVYLWNKDLPGYDEFDPRQYADSRNELNGLNSSLFALTRYALNPGTNRPYEYSSYDPTGETKYSYIDDLSQDGVVSFRSRQKSDIDDNGNAADFGLRVGLYGYRDRVNYETYIQYVFPNSPAEKKGLKRGDIITNINGKPIGNNINDDSEYDAINNGIFYSNSVTMTVTHKAGGSSEVTLNKSTYPASVVMLDSVYTEGSKKTGYLAFYQFTDPEHANPELDMAFDRFSAAGVNNLIVDLRYNGGGYVATAEHLINLIAPSSLDGKVMFTEYYNEDMQQGKASILEKQPLLDAHGHTQTSNGKIVTYADLSYTAEDNDHTFSDQQTGLNLSSVVFIVTGQTASASELVINSLKPYITVKLVGDDTYGKPVGFFPIRIGHYDVYYSLFQSKNASDEGDYFDGMIADQQATDAAWEDLGDREEDCLKSAMDYVNNGSFTVTDNRQMSIRRDGSTEPIKLLNAANKRLNPDAFRGMIETPARLVK